MSRQISATRRIKVTDNNNDCYVLIFKVPSQSKIRAIRQASLDPQGKLDETGFAEKMTRETLDLLMDVEGAIAQFDENPDSKMTVSSAMLRQDVQKIKDFYRQNDLEYFADAPDWKGVFMTLFPDVFERSILNLWTNHVQNGLNEVSVGK